MHIKNLVWALVLAITFVGIPPTSAQTITGSSIPDNIALRLFLLDATNQGPAHTAAVVAKLRLSSADASIAYAAFASFSSGLEALEKTNPSRVQMYSGLDQLTATAKSTLSRLSVASEFDAFLQHEKNNMRVSDIDPGWGPIAEQRLKERSMVSHAGHSMAGMPTLSMCGASYSSYNSNWFSTAQNGQESGTVWNTSSTITGDCPGGYPPPSTRHTPRIRMQVGTSGIYASGTPVFPSAYINFGKSVAFPMSLWGDFSSPLYANFDTEIVCSISGLFYDLPDFGSVFGFYIAPAVTADAYDPNGPTTSLGSGWYAYAVAEDQIQGDPSLPACDDPLNIDMSLSYKDHQGGIQDTTQQPVAWLSLGLVAYSSNNNVLFQLESAGRSILSPDPFMALSIPIPNPFGNLMYPCTCRRKGVTGYPTGIPWPW